MKKSYKITRIILLIIELITFIIVFRNNDHGIIIALILSFIAFLMSFLTMFISKLIIKIGKKLKPIYRTFYYLLVLPVLIIGLLLVSLIILLSIFRGINEPSLIQAYAFIFIEVVFSMLILIPYVQSIMVIMIDKILENR